MKKIMLFTTAAIFVLSACDNGNRGIQNDGDADNDLMELRDTSAIEGELNSRGLPAQGIPDNNALRGDSIDVGGNIENNEEMRNLPDAVSVKITQDESLRNKKLTNSREFSEGGKTYYELTFDSGASTMTVDAEGNKKNQ